MAITIGDILYSSQEWYDEHITGKGKQAVGGVEVPIEQPIVPQQDEPPIGDDLGTLNVPADTETPALDIGTATSRTDYWQKYFEDQQTRADEAQAKRDKAQADFDIKQQSWWDKISGKQSTEDKREEEFAELGFDAPEYFAERRAEIAEMQGLYDSYNAKAKERDMAVAGVAGVGMPQGWMDDRKIVITNKYNAELNGLAAGINSKAAIMEAKQNNFNEARSFADQAVADYTADLRYEYERYNEFVDMNQDLLDDLGAEYKDFVEQENAAMLQRLTLEEQDKTAVMQLMQDAKGKAGITIEDTLEEANNKYVKWLSQQPVEATEFTTTQKLALEQAGLANVDRQTQLDYLRENGFLGEPIEETNVPGVQEFKDAFQVFLDVNWTREDVERQYRSENKIAEDEDLPSVVEEALDELYPTTFWDKFKFWE